MAHNLRIIVLRDTAMWFLISALYNWRLINCWYFAFGTWHGGVLKNFNDNIITATIIICFINLCQIISFTPKSSRKAICWGDMISNFRDGKTGAWRLQKSWSFSAVNIITPEKKPTLLTAWSQTFSYQSDSQWYGSWMFRSVRKYISAL